MLLLHLSRHFHSFKQLINERKSYFVYCVLKKWLLPSNLLFWKSTSKWRRKIMIQRQKPIKTAVCISKIRLGGWEGRKKKQHRPWNCRNSRTSDALDKSQAKSQFQLSVYYYLSNFVLNSNKTDLNYFRRETKQ